MRHTYIILLRAVNVAGKNIIKMAELKIQLEKIFPAVKTYIQSGNIIIQSLSEKKIIQDSVADLIKVNFGLDIEVFVLSISELHYILTQNPFPDSCPANKVFITLLKEVPKEENIAKLNLINLGEEKFTLKENVFYSYVSQGMANAKLSNLFVEKILKVRATGRNLNTMQKLCELINS